jgi:hypothetical protein
MGKIEKATTDVTAIERGSTDVNYVYRGSTLIWQKVQPLTPQTIKVFQTLINSEFKENQYQTLTEATYKNQI